MMDAILNDHLVSLTISTEKWEYHQDQPKTMFIRTYLKKWHAAIAGGQYDRRLLKFALIGRDDFRTWCDRWSIPLPEFWFPSGWKLDYEWPSEDLGEHHEVFREPSEASAENVRDSTRRRFACQQIAIRLWEENPQTTIADMIRHELIREYGGAKYYENDTVRTWLSAVATDSIRGRRGRPRKIPSNQTQSLCEG
ncbi:MAG: hypothetical protein HGA47_00040 [Zoogloea sp.]|nr:hypothetical protein [Zoogloea sp.]